MKEWIRCLLYCVAMAAAYLLTYLFRHKTIEPLEDSLLFSFIGGFIVGGGLYIGDRIRRKNQVNKEKINKYLNKKEDEL